MLLAEAPVQDSRNTNVPNTDTHFVMPAYGSLQKWQVRRDFLRNQILSAAGLLPLPKRTDLRPQVFGRIDRGQYSIEKVLLETLPGYYLGGNLYRPRPSGGKHPAVLTPHGHWTYGRLENSPNFSGPALGISLAKQGYVVFAYDMVGYNDTVQTPHDFGGPHEQLWAFGPFGLQLWNSIRAVDFVSSLPDVDPEKIAVTGASGGGTQTFFLAAVDARIKYAAPVNMVSAIMQGGCVCENAPNLRIGTFNVEIASLIAPRPMLLVSATGDWTKNVPKEEFPAIQRIYGLYGQPENLEVVQFEADHNYNQQSREAVYRFFGKWILGQSDGKRFAERGIRPEKLQDMLVLHNRRVPDNAVDYKALFEEWKAASCRQAEEIRDRNFMRERLAYALMAEWPEQVNAEVKGENVVLSRPGQGDMIPGIWIQGKGPAALVVHPEGAQVARNLPAVVRIVASSRTMLLIDAFQTGSARSPRDRSHRHFLTFNKTDDANRVQDILTALCYLNAKTGGKVELIGLGKAAVWALFAAAIAPVDLKLTADLGDFKGTDEDFLSQLYVPGIQRAGGLKAALELTADRRKQP